MKRLNALFNWFRLGIRKKVIRWTLLTILIAPFPTLIHEEGHFVAAKINGYTNTKFHYASVHRGDPPAEVEADGQRAQIVAGGLLATSILALGCCVYVAFHKTNIIFILLGLLSPIRNLATTFAGFYILAYGDSLPRLQKNDEVKLAGLLEISAFVPIVISVIVLFGTWVFILRRIEFRDRGKLALSLIVGAAIGNALWLNVVGPLAFALTLFYGPKGSPRFP